MKKISKFITVLAVSVTLSSTLIPTVNKMIGNEPQIVEAATRRETVKIGGITYYIYNVNHYYSYSKVKKAVEEGNKLNGNMYYQAGKFLLGSTNILTGTYIALGDYTAANGILSKKMKTAIAQKKGIRIKYQLLTNYTPSLNKYRNKSITVE